MAYDWRGRGRRWVKRWFPLTVPDEPTIPVGWAAEIIDAWSRTGLIGEMARDAIANARRNNRMDDAHRYRLMLDQFMDWHAKLP